MRRAIAKRDEVDVDKAALFGYPAGKARIADQLVALIPTHKTYVEPFCGSAAVFVTKAP